MDHAVGDRVLSNWTLTQKIGQGGFGTVFQAQREDFGRVYQAAIKIISIPRNESEMESIRGDGMDEASVRTYFQGLVNDLVTEMEIMARLKGNSNIVSYEDHQIVPHPDGLGWDIIIRMELLTPLLKRARERQFTRTDAIQVGIDLCKALELCRKHRIIHRDIKPENIFFSPAGDYKLGDFGIARTVEKTSGSFSKKGTYSYMAPEVYWGQPYGATVDIYSLGMVLYWLCNRYRTPFLPAYPAPVAYHDREEAIARRMTGELLPPPSDADPALAAVILKACSYAPDDRYASAERFRQALERLELSEASAEGRDEGQAEARTEALAESTLLLPGLEPRISPKPTENASGGETSIPEEDRTELLADGESVSSTAIEYTPPGKKPRRRVLWGVCAAFAAVAVAVGLLLFRYFGLHRSPGVIGQVYAFEGSSYALYDPTDIKTWAEAERFCEEQGGHLATPESQEESDFLFYILENMEAPAAFFGLCDWGENGAWVWYDGQAATFVNWAEGEPNCQDGKEHYGLIFQSDDPKYAGGKWIDAAFPELTLGTTAFICEWDG